MSEIKICKAHSLDPDECRAVAEDLLDQLVTKFGGSVREQNEQFQYRHSSGVKASVIIQPGELQVNVKLGLMARSFAPQMRSAIQEVLDEQLV